jgi:hypothetical protein
MTRTTAGGWVAGGVAALLAAGLALAPALAQTGGRWLHVRVVDGSEKAASVKVNLPVSVLETMAQSIEDDHFRDGKIEIGHDGFDAAQLQDLWKAIRASQDMEFVTVESDDATVKVAKSGKYLLANVDGRDGDGGKVQVKVPLDVVDALLSAPKGQLNVKAAIEALAKHDDGALVQVHDGSNDVKVWIDSKAEADV